MLFDIWVLKTYLKINHLAKLFNSCTFAKLFTSCGFTI